MTITLLVSPGGLFIGCYTIEMTIKIAVVSDTHQHSLKTILDGCKADVLIHCGDALNLGTQKEWTEFTSDLAGILNQFTQIIYVPGNHDIYVEQHKREALEDLKDLGVHMLIDESVVFFKWNSLRTDLSDESVKIYGSPWVPYISSRWAFQKYRGEQLARTWENIPEGLDILITHGPPHGILDQSIFRGGRMSENYGCKDLTERLQTMKNPPKYHVMGHIHSANGTLRVGSTTYINASICSEDYAPIYKPAIIEI